MFDDYTIIYYLVVFKDTNRGESIFCGFNNDYFNLLETFWDIIEYPISIWELDKEEYNIILRRTQLRMSHKIIPLTYESYEKMIPQMPFCCVVYDSVSFPNLPTIVKNWKVKPLFIKFEDTKTINNISFYKHYKKYGAPIFKQFQVTLNKKCPNTFESPLKNINIMNSFTYLPCFSPNENDEDIWKRICDLNNLRQKISKRAGKTIDCILTSFPIYSKNDLENNIMKHCPDDLKVYVNKLISQKSFSIDESICHNKYFSIRNNEKLLYLFCMGLVYQNYMCSMYQIPIGVQTDTKHEIYDLQKADNSKIPKVYRRLLDKINKYVHEDIVQTLPTYRIPKIKIYSDAPIEFYIDPIYNLPLLISSDITKVPMTPGTDFFNQIMYLSNLYISYEDLSKILIIRSYADNADIKDDLINEINKIQKSLKSVKIDIKDVENSIELVNLFNELTDYNIVIFDCHGSQVLSESHGYLVLKEEKFDIWEKRFIIDNLPPIILFSTCVTNIYDMSANSIANGFLASGVRATLATTSSVKSIDSAIFMTRIIQRLDTFITAYIGTKEELDWSDFICRTTRLFFIEDVLNYYCIDDDNKRAFLENITYYIDYGSIKWYEILLNKLSFWTKKDINTLQGEIVYNLAYCESLKYISLGNADKIILFSETYRTNQNKQNNS